MNEENGGATSTEGATEKAGLTADQVQELIQKAVGDVSKEWQSRFDRKNTELQNLRREKMTDEERIKAEIAEEKQRLEAERTTFRGERLRNLRSLAVTGKNLPADFADFIGGDDEKDIPVRVDKLHGLIEAEVSKRVQAAIYGGNGNIPKAGDPIPANLDDAAYMQARFAKLNGK